MKEYTAKPFGTGRYLLGESARYDARTGVLSFVDITAGKGYLSADGEHFEEYDFGQMIGALVPASIPGTYYACLTDGIYLFDTGDGKKSHRLLFDLTDVFQPWQRSNDAELDPRGRLFLGSHVFREECGSTGDLYCVENGVIRVLEKETKISNGMAWSADHKKFFFSETLAKGVFVYDYDEVTGNISDRRMLFSAGEGTSSGHTSTVEGTSSVHGSTAEGTLSGHDLTEEERMPGLTDGMCIDSADRLWVAYWGGSRVECRSTEDGSLLAVVHVPAQNVTSCCFTSEKERRLFITTARDTLSGQYDGSLFYADLD